MPFSYFPSHIFISSSYLYLIPYPSSITSITFLYSTYTLPYPSLTPLPPRFPRTPANVWCTTVTSDLFEKPLSSCLTLTLAAEAPVSSKGGSSGGGGGDTLSQTIDASMSAMSLMDNTSGQLTAPRAISTRFTAAQYMRGY